MTHFNKDQIQKLYHYALSLSKNTDNAYDLVQSTLERCLRHSAQPDNQMAYARTILRNLFIDAYRIQEQVQEESYDDEIVSMHLDMQPLEQLMIDRDELEKIWSLLQPFETEVLYL